MDKATIAKWVGFIGGLLSFLAAQASMFPVEYQGYITVASGIVSSISAWLLKSPTVQGG
jgi:hypothetical protein